MTDIILIKLDLLVLVMEEEQFYNKTALCQEYVYNAHDL